MSSGVDRILAVGSDLSSSEQAIALAHTFDCVYAAVGVHPHEASSFAMDATAVRSLLRERKVVAVGEIGLDYYRGTETRELQLEAFSEQLKWARERGTVVSVHNRAADLDVLGCLLATGNQAILHCFSGSSTFAEHAVREGCYLSFAGNLTFPKANDLRSVAKNVPADRVLVETDSPVLAPQNWRGRTCEPAFVVATAQTLAGVRGVSTTQMAATLAANANRVLGWGTA